ncbi:helix-turn-helix domain-containing protein [Micromonospora sp. KC207]|uniref:helix-turn-helix domain-containing protein n=1 Tax=Micromonospora sp. KC207 TaxID=2530377 RepID=UPI001404C2DC|nr:helix-turn-helix domain-containing protein [Micromonospora sp. KC207]
MDEVIERVGRQLRLLRRARGLTLAELASRAGCTDGYLANVEKGVTTPTLSSIATLAAVLGSDMTAFFPTKPREQVHIHRADELDHLRVAASGTETYTVLSARSVNPSFTGLLDEILPSPAGTSYSYFGERFLLMLDGTVELRIGSTAYPLGPGDSLHYSSHPDHLLRVTSATPATILWIVTPALL